MSRPDLRLPQEPSRGAGRSVKTSPGALRAVLAALFLVVAVVLIGAYTFLPPLVSAFVARDLKDQLGLGSAPEVELGSDPPPEILAGKFDRGKVELKEPELGGVRPDRVAVALDPFDVDLLRSVLGGSLESRKPLSGTLQAEISEREIERIVAAGVNGYAVNGVDLRQGAMLVETGVEVLGFGVPVAVEGGLKIRGGALAFEPRRVVALGVPVPRDLSERLLSGTEFSYPLDDLPHGTKLSGVEVSDGKLVLSGRMERIPLKAPSRSG